MFEHMSIWCIYYEIYKRESQESSHSKNWLHLVLNLNDKMKDQLNTNRFPAIK